jgi:hypothetical protein
MPQEIHLGQDQVITYDPRGALRGVPHGVLVVYESGVAVNCHRVDLDTGDASPSGQLYVTINTEAAPVTDHDIGGEPAMTVDLNQSTIWERAKLSTLVGQRVRIPAYYAKDLGLAKVEEDGSLLGEVIDYPGADEHGMMGNRVAVRASSGSVCFPRFEWLEEAE